MAAAANSLRWCVRAAGRRSYSGLGASTTRAAVSATLTFHPSVRAAVRRSLSLTVPRNSNDGKDDDDVDDLSTKRAWKRYSMEEKDAIRQMDLEDDLPHWSRLMKGEMTEEESEIWGKFSPEEIAEISKADKKAMAEFQEAETASMAPVLKNRNPFWNEGEWDEDLMVEETDQDDEFQEDDMMAMAHAKLEEHREMREYARLAMWEMPLLAKFAKTFEPPTNALPLRWRYTSYMGEFHPAEKKVVVEFSPHDLPLTDVQKSKLMKLVGTRYNPGKETIKMSCENFEHPAQNKRYLGDLIAKLVAEAKDPTDTFEDIPLDTRHYTSTVKPKFPPTWRLTNKRREHLARLRQSSYDLDMAKKAAGQLVDGRERIKAALGPTPADVALEASAEESINMLAADNRNSLSHLRSPR